MTDDASHRLQGLVFGLVAAAFTNVCLTQPVLPVLAEEFGVDEAGSSLSVSAVVLGIALATPPFGGFVDRYPMRPLVLVGGVVVGSGALVLGLPLVIGLLEARESRRSVPPASAAEGPAAGV